MVVSRQASGNISAFDAKNRLGRLLDRVQAGEELVITRRGQAVARLVPARNQAGQAAEALAAFKRVRQALAAKRVKVSRAQVRGWREEGRR